MTQPILLLTENFPPKTGGSGRWFWELYRRMPHEALLIAAGEDPRQGGFDATHDLPVVRLPLHMSAWGLMNLRGFVGYMRRLALVGKLARKHRVVRLHCGRTLPEGWIAWLLKKTLGVPYLCYVHGEELSLGIVSRELGWMLRHVLKSSDLLIANSRNTANLLWEQWNVPSERVVVMHPGVDIARFVPADRCEETRARLGWQGRRVILTVGRLQKRKGHDQLIRALPEVRRAVPDVLYAIVGDGEERPHLERIVGELGLTEHVCFHGELDDADLVRCYQQCDLFVLPNRNINGDIEGFGMVLLEAQACGKPVIAGASGGTAETMQVPQTGRIVPCDGPEQLARVATELLLDCELRERMGKAARRWTFEHFSWESLTRQARTIFDEISGEGPKGRDTEQSAGACSEPPTVAP